MAKVSVKHVAWARLRREVPDTSAGDTASVEISIRNRSGKVVGTIRLGMRPENAALSCRLKATLAKGTCRWYVLAADCAGNTQPTTGSSILTVR